MVHFHLNLPDALAGRVKSSPSLVLAMLRNLPEGARYVATLSAPVGGDKEQDDPPPLDPELEGLLDRMTWNEDRRLLAQLLNQVNFLISHCFPWQEGKAPEFPIVGPAEWRREAQTHKQGSKTMMDLLREMGHVG